MRENIGKQDINRYEKDFYKTPTKCVQDIIKNENIKNMIVLDNSCGDGRISKELVNNKNITYNIDIVDRGYELDILGDFLKQDLLDVKPDCAVYNPPFKLLNEFIIHTFKFTDIQYVFCRLQVLESVKRYEKIFKHGYLEKIYVYVNRQVLKEVDGYKFNSMCFCWIKLNKKYKGKPTIEWINK